MCISLIDGIGGESASRCTCALAFEHLNSEFLHEKVKDSVNQ
jgi:hypothetical protein